jgi:TRAP-type C4-dicarboxylate transport system substrate-binding protein
MALQTGVIDGQENPLVTIATFKFNEVQKHCALSNHVWDGFIQVANPRIWKDLPKDLQEIVTRNVNSAALKQREDVKNGNDNIRKQLQDKGMTFNEVDQAAFRAVLKNAKFYQEWQKKFSPEAWAALEKYSGPLV